MNANNGIPFYPNPSLFRKGFQNGIIKQSRSNELKLKIVFFGEIEFKGRKYYKYACYNHNGKIHYLELMTSSATNTENEQNQKFVLHMWEQGAPPNSLTFSSTRNKRHVKQVNLPKTITNVRQNGQVIKQNFGNRRQKLVVRKINQQNININNSTDLSEILGHFSFIEDPNGIKLSELEKKESDFPFKIIRKSSLFPVRVGEPIILFGEIKINRETYYQYCCYKSRGIGSKDGVSFRKLSNDSNDLNRFRNKNKTMYNRNALVSRPNNQNRTSIKERIYLYFIGINDVEHELLESLFEFIKNERSSKRNQLLFRTIYEQLSQVVSNNNNIGEEGNIQLQEMKQRNIAFNGNPDIFKKKQIDGNIKKTFSDKLHLIPFFGEMRIDGQKYYRYACYIFQNNIHFITLQLYGRNKINVVKIDRSNVVYDLNDLFKKLLKELTSLKTNHPEISEQYFIDCKTSISEMCRLLDIQVPNNNQSRRNPNFALRNGNGNGNNNL